VNGNEASDTKAETRGTLREAGAVGPSGPNGQARGARRRRGRAAQAEEVARPEPGWYRDAIIYELHVRAFQDSNDDGIGDFKGLTSRLDYLQELGVTAIWLLPFYPSPLRDDGYDIAHYTSVNTDYGTMRDFRKFVDEAHRRGLRVITELVINHTSDQHPWFQRARRAPKGSKHRDFYVWSDSPEKYPGVRIIFQDTETSNWTWDPVAEQYYWHRFFSHQPDLNFDNPEVRAEIIKIMDFWFEAGVDGMRLDAVPYLVEREGTNCENLPETHAVLRTLRRHLDENWPGRMFLAEANQWPEDAVAYFGDGDECHMNFHFPLMPRLFMSLRMEDRYPVVDILEQTPEVPEGCQWAIFLRNHDELTLEMVTDEERDYMYRVYARDRQMRINVGIRRRLAPLLENDRRKIELMKGLLLSLPGTPVLYYGDEIGMGDNFYLGDRDAVRTPMQWNGDRNAGFSKANPHSLYLPVILDSAYHYETVNVESQQTTQTSLLSWTKRIIRLRRRHPVMARGELEFLHPDNPKVLAFLRRGDDEDILVLANLSRFIQPVELDLSQFNGRTPVELFGYTRFPKIGELPYFVTLGPHSFFWFKLEAPKEETAEEIEPPTVEITTEPGAWFRGAGLKRWAARELANILPRQRWFAGKARVIRDVSVEDVITLPTAGEGVAQVGFVLARIDYTEGDEEYYSLPLAILDGERAASADGAVLAHLKKKGETARLALIDAAHEEGLWRTLHDLVRRGRTVKGSSGSVIGVRSAAGKKRDPRAAPPRDVQDVRVLRSEQSNTSAIFDQASILKLFRRVEEGVNPDVEIGQRLTESRRFSHAPPLQGSIEYRPSKDRVITLAAMQGFVPNEGDSWRFTLDAVSRFFERAVFSGERRAEPTLPAETALGHSGREAHEHESALFDGHLELIELLGRRTAEMHVALADSTVADFAPEPVTKLYQRSLYQSMRNGIERPMQGLSKGLKTLEETPRELAERVLARKSELMGRVGTVRELPLDGVRIRCHGDYHLGQVLWTGQDFVIIDFEGEPMRPLGERRLKRSPLMDVAGMLRSLDYAASAGYRVVVERGLAPEETGAGAQIREWTTWWSFIAQAAFLRGYRAHIDPALIPGEHRALASLLDAWTLQKAAYEVRYELNNRPDWIEIPLRGILRVLDTGV